MNLSDYSPVIQALLEEHDLHGLMAALRSPTNAELRLQAAQAMGDLQDFDATESLIRSTLEDPDLAVQTAARLALTSLHGNRSRLVIESYRAAPPHDEPWLLAPEMEEPLPMHMAEGDLSEDDIHGLIQVVSHESNPTIRMKAIRALGQFGDTRASELLSYLARNGDSAAIRSAAREALEAHFGEQADDLIAAADLDLDLQDDMADFEEVEDVQIETDENDAQDEDDEDEVELGESRHPSRRKKKNDGLGKTRRPSEFEQVPKDNRDGRVLQEVGVSLRMLIVTGILFLIILALAFTLFRP